jgi:hypothetical protein
MLKSSLGITEPAAQRNKTGVQSARLCKSGAAYGKTALRALTGPKGRPINRPGRSD